MSSATRFGFQSAFCADGIYSCFVTRGFQPGLLQCRTFGAFLQLFNYCFIPSVKTIDFQSRFNRGRVFCSPFCPGFSPREPFSLFIQLSLSGEREGGFALILILMAVHLPAQNPIFCWVLVPFRVQVWRRALVRRG